MTTIEFFRTAYFIRNSEHTRHSNMLRVRDDLRAPAGLAHDVWDAWLQQLHERGTGRCAYVGVFVEIIYLGSQL